MERPIISVSVRAEPVPSIATTSDVAAELNLQATDQEHLKTCFRDYRNLPHRTLLPTW
jgi:hypothetical protein